MATTTSPTVRVAAGLRRWWGYRCLEGEAAIELLIGYDHGRLLDGPWIVRTPVFRRYEFRPDPEDYGTQGRERSGLTARDALVLQVAASVTSIEFPGVAVNRLLDLDRKTLALVIASYAHIACRDAGDPLPLDFHTCTPRPANHNKRNTEKGKK